MKALGLTNELVDIATQTKWILWLWFWVPM